MKRVPGFAFVFLVCAGFVAACLNPNVVPPPPVIGDYRAQTAPESVLHNLEVSYRRQEIEPYTKLLRSDFLFVFQPGDEPLGGEEGWNRDQDSTGTAALFTSDDVATIRIDLTYGPAVPATELDKQGYMKIRVNPTFLEIDQLGTDITLQVDGDIQDMFFLRGDPDKGEDPTLWYLAEWRDIPGGAGAPRRGREQLFQPWARRSTSWGALRTGAGRR